MKELNYLTSVNHRLRLDAAENARMHRSAMRRIDRRSFSRAVRSHSRVVMLDMTVVGAICMGVGVMIAFLARV